MLTDSILVERRMIVFMQRLYQLIERVTLAVGDMSFAEYGLAVNAAEMDHGLPLRAVQPRFSQFSNMLHYIELLEQKELVQRVRSHTDRRGYAVVTSDKGRARIGLADKTVALLFINEERRLTEELFEELVMRMRSFSVAADPTRRIFTLMPGTVLEYVGVYHLLLAEESSHMGLSSLQMSILCCLASESDPVTTDVVALRLGLPLDVAEMCLVDLAERRLLREESGWWELRDEGSRRVATFLARFVARFDGEVGMLDDELIVLLESLVEFFAYLLV